MISETDLIINPDGSVYHLNLKPQHIADVVIVVGDPGRVHRISSHFDSIDFEMNKREFITHVGRYKGKKITVLSTGMGTDNVEIVMTELDALVNIDLRTLTPKTKKKKLKIIRIGTSGGIQEDLKLGTHLMSEYAIGLDALMSFYPLIMTNFEQEVSDKIRSATNLPYPIYCVKGSEQLIELFADVTEKGNTVTTPGFYAPQGRSIRIPTKFPEIITQLNYFHLDHFWLTNMEMETAAYYAFGRMLGHEIISLNAILANRIRNRFTKDPNKIVDSLITKALDKIALM